MISIDGSYGEGGGQIVRTALALSMITQKSFCIENIRVGRSDPGLKAQHLAGLKALKQLSSSTSSDAQVGSSSLTFTPALISKKRAEVDIGTAGSIPLLLQTLLLPLMFCKHRTQLVIVGGTDVEWSPQIDYVTEVILPQFMRYAGIHLQLEKRGYYPKGGGKVLLTITPKNEEYRLPLMLLHQQRLVHIKGVSHASADLEDARVAERQAHAAQGALACLDCDTSIRSEYHQTPSTGSGITLAALFSTRADEIDVENPVRIGADVLGKQGVRAEEIGKQAADALQQEIMSGAPVDKHLADHLIPLLGMVGGSFTTSEITGHLKTNMYVTKQFLNAHFRIENTTVIVEKEKAVRPLLP
ncbi:RNA 3'-terminal phosphate cyclase [Candidatus Woesearchaeota archaeon]|nr:RNA 3'-terminal phosphate cyclase [Candidatus Woesearchaeota archaeon]